MSSDSEPEEDLTASLEESKAEEGVEDEGEAGEEGDYGEEFAPELPEADGGGEGDEDGEGDDDAAELALAEDIQTEDELQTAIKREVTRQRITGEFKVTKKQLSAKEIRKQEARLRETAQKIIAGRYVPGKFVEWYDDEAISEHPEFDPKMEAEFPFLKKTQKTYPLAVQRKLVPQKAKELLVEGLTEKEMIERRLFYRDVKMNVYVEGTKRQKPQYPAPGKDAIRQAIEVKEAEIQTLINQIAEIKKTTDVVELPSPETTKAINDEIQELTARIDDSDYFRAQAEKVYPLKKGYTPWLPDPSDREHRINSLADAWLRNALKRREELNTSLAALEARTEPQSRVRVRRTFRFSASPSSPRAFEEYLARSIKEHNDLSTRVKGLEAALRIIKVKLRPTQVDLDRAKSIEYDLDFYRSFKPEEAAITLRKPTLKTDLQALQKETAEAIKEKDEAIKAKLLANIQDRLRTYLYDATLDLSEEEIEEIRDIRTKIIKLRQEIIDIEATRPTVKVPIDFATLTGISRVTPIRREKPRLAILKKEKVVISGYRKLDDGVLVRLQGSNVDLLVKEKDFQLLDPKANIYDQRYSIGSLTMAPAPKSLKTDETPTKVLAIITDFTSQKVTVKPLLTATININEARIEQINQKITLLHDQELAKSRIEILVNLKERLEASQARLRSLKKASPANVKKELVGAQKSKLESDAKLPGLKGDAYDEEKKRNDELADKIKDLMELAAGRGTKPRSAEIENLEKRIAQLGPETTAVMKEEVKKLKAILAEQSSLKKAAATTYQVTYDALDEANGPEIITKTSTRFSDRAVDSEVVAYYVQTYSVLLREILPRPEVKGGLVEKRWDREFQTDFAEELAKGLPDFFEYTPKPKAAPPKKPDESALIEKAIQSEWRRTIFETYEGPSKKAKDRRAERKKIVEELVDRAEMLDQQKLPDEILEELVEGTSLPNGQSIFYGVNVLARDGVLSIVKNINQIKGGYDVVQRFKVKLFQTLGSEEPLSLEELIRSTVNEEVRYIRGLPGPYGLGLTRPLRLAAEERNYMQSIYQAIVTGSSKEAKAFRKDRLTSSKYLRWRDEVVAKDAEVKERASQAAAEAKKKAESVEVEKPTEAASLITWSDSELVLQVSEMMARVLSTQSSRESVTGLSEMMLGVYIAFQSVLAVRFSYIKHSLKVGLTTIQSLPFLKPELAMPELYLSPKMASEVAPEGVSDDIKNLSREAFQRLEWTLTPALGKMAKADTVYPHSMEDLLVDLDDVCQASTKTGTRLLTFTEVMKKAVEIRHFPYTPAKEAFQVTEKIPDDDLILDVGVGETATYQCSSIREILDDYYYGGKRYSSGPLKGQSLPKNYSSFVKNFAKPNKLETAKRLTGKQSLDIEKAAERILEVWKEKVEGPRVEVAVSTADKPKVEIKPLAGITAKRVYVPGYPNDTRVMMTTSDLFSDGSLKYLISDSLNISPDVTVLFISSDKDVGEALNEVSIKSREILPILTFGYRGKPNLVEDIKRLAPDKRILTFKNKILETPKKIPEPSWIIRNIVQHDLGTLEGVDDGQYLDLEALEDSIRNFVLSGAGRIIVEELWTVSNGGTFSKDLIPKLATEYLDLDLSQEFSVLSSEGVSEVVLDYLRRTSTSSYFAMLIRKQIFGDPYLYPVTVDDIESSVSQLRKTGVTDLGLSPEALSKYNAVVKRFSIRRGKGQTGETVVQFGGYETPEDITSQSTVLLRSLLERPPEERIKLLNSLLKSKAVTLENAMVPRSKKSKWSKLMNVINGDAEAKALMIVRVHSLLSAEEKEKYKLVDGAGKPVVITTTKQQEIISKKFSEAYFTLKESQRKSIGKIENLTDIVKILFETKRDSGKAWSWINEALRFSHLSYKIKFYDELGFKRSKTKDEDETKKKLFEIKFAELELDKQIELTEFKTRKFNTNKTNMERFVEILLGKQL